MKVKLLMIAEVEVEQKDAAIEEAHDKLDAFREATLTGQNYGITLFCIHPRDMSEDLALHGKEVCGGE